MNIVNAYGKNIKLRNNVLLSVKHTGIPGSYSLRCHASEKASI